MKLLTETAKEKYLKYFNEDVINEGKLVKWCPGKDCGRVIQVEENVQQDVKCDCGFSFCFKCLRFAHEPVDCYTLSKYQFYGVQEKSTE